VHPDSSLEGYGLVVVPCLLVVSDTLVESLRATGAQVVIGPRTGSRDVDFAIPPELAPGKLSELCGFTVARSESLRPGLEHDGDGWVIAHWLDHVVPGHAAEAELVARDGTVASMKHGRVRTSLTWPQGAVIDELFERAARDAGLVVEVLAEGTRRRTTSAHVFEFDYPAARFSVTPQSS
ncbi:MAG: beta-galactosidase trimerization domain-containing protein, partial [Pseudomonadota bacterium]